MEGTILTQLKSISLPTWKPGLAPQTSTQAQVFQASKNLKDSEQYNEDVTREQMTSCLNTDITQETDHPKSNSLSTEQESVILYTTSLRGIRKTFEDCGTIRFLLQSFRIVYYERDVSMHLEYREELWRILGRGVIPPKLFIRGRCIGGADEVVGLHEKGMLMNLVKGIPLNPGIHNPCRGCGGIHFVLCLRCNGSRKVVSEGQNRGLRIRCQSCNENGLVKCMVCS